MELKDHKRRTLRIAWALSVALATTSCINVPQGSTYGRSELPTNFDGGVGQLLNYCGKLRKSGKLVMAAGICERAYRLDPGNPEPLVQLAEILVQMGQLEGAENVYRNLIEIAPDNVEARYTLGKIYIVLEKYDHAIIELETASSRKAGDPRIYNALGVANALIGAHDSAQRVFRAGLQQAPDDTSLRNNLGLSLAMSGRYGEGISLLQRIAAGRNANRTSHQNLQLALGMARTARDENVLALAALPDDLMRHPPDHQEAVAPDGSSDTSAPDTQLQVAEFPDLDDRYEEDDAELQPESEPMVLTEALPPLDLSSQRAQIAAFEDFAPPALPLDLPPDLALDFEVSEPVWCHVHATLGCGGRLPSPASRCPSAVSINEPPMSQFVQVSRTPARRMWLHTAAASVREAPRHASETGSECGRFPAASRPSTPGISFLPDFVGFTPDSGPTLRGLQTAARTRTGLTASTPIRPNRPYRAPRQPRLRHRRRHHKRYRLG